MSTTMQFSTYRSAGHPGGGFDSGANRRPHSGPGGLAPLFARVGIAGRLRRTAAIAFAVAICLAGPGSAQDSSPFDPSTGYRIERYRAPVDRVPDGVTRLGLDDLQRLIAEVKPVLIDVLPAEGGRPDPATGQWQLARPHSHIPGSHWLPEVGRGKLEPWQERYFAARMAALTGGDTTRQVVIYCQSDCWMAYNALKRAQALGYSRLYWFPEGTDGWRDFDADLVPATPDTVPPDVLGAK